MKRWLIILSIAAVILSGGLFIWSQKDIPASIDQERVDNIPFDVVTPIQVTPEITTPLSSFAQPTPPPSVTIQPESSPTPQPTSEPETIFTDQIPQNLSQRWGRPYELGTRFCPQVDGEIQAVRVYAAQTESGQHTVSIWDWKAAALVAGPYQWEFSGSGWHEFTLPASIPVYAHTDYVVSVSTGDDPTHDFVSTIDGFEEPTASFNLMTYPDSGVATQTLGSLPNWTIPGNRNFFRDVVFIPATAEANLPPQVTPNSVQNTTYYVATSGNNAWSGQLPEPNAQHTDGPWRTIRRAADSLQPGDTVYVRGGTYHEWVWLEADNSGTETAPITYAAYPGEEVILDGAAYPTQWQLYSGSIWWTDASGIDFNWEGQARLVWQNDIWLEHSSTLGGISEGTWWYDTSSERLYVWLRGIANPAQSEIAVSELRNAFHLNLTSWIVLDGFHIIHYYRGISQMDSVADQGRNMAGLAVRNCVIEHVGEGIGLAGATFGTWGFTHHSRIENNIIRDTQSDAIWIGSGVDHIVQGNTISDVKQAWYRGFVSSAIILGNADDSIIERNVIYDVHALGIDVEHFYNGGYGNRNIVRRNYVHDVGGHAIVILGANDTRVENNLITDVQIFGILVNTNAGPALNNELFNNTIDNVADRAIAIIEGQPVDSLGLVPQDTRIQNNIFHNVTNWGIYDEGEGTSADYNLYWQMHSGVAFWGGATRFTLADFQSTGQETHGVAKDPLFLLPGDFRLDEFSPAIDTGSNVDAPVLDYWGMVRPWDGNNDSVAVVDIGAHEWTGPLQKLYFPVIIRD